MRAELMLMGRRVDMSRQARRRILVIAIYVALAGLLAGSYALNHWHSTSSYFIWAVILVNWLFLGGYHRGGLLKPFNGKAPKELPQPSALFPLQLRFGLYRPVLNEGEYRNDERELHQRDIAHYRAYQGLTVILILLWFLDDWRQFAPTLVHWLPGGVDVAIYGVIQIGVLLSQTLPQCILLWTEPDMEAEFPEA